MRTRRSWQPAIAFFLNSSFHFAGATARRSAKMNAQSIECLDDQRATKVTKPEGELSPIPRMSLRHSELFYLGLLPVILFLLAWADSATMHTNWHHRLEGGSCLGLINENSAFRIEHIRPMPANEAGASVPATPIYGGIYRFGAPVHDQEGNSMPLFPSFSRRDPLAIYRAADWHVDVFVIPIWFVLSCYLPLWLAISYFQLRRKWKKLHSALPCNRSSSLQ